MSLKKQTNKLTLNCTKCRCKATGAAKIDDDGALLLVKVGTAVAVVITTVMVVMPTEDPVDSKGDSKTETTRSVEEMHQRDSTLEAQVATVVEAAFTFPHKLFPTLGTTFRNHFLQAHL